MTPQDIHARLRQIDESGWDSRAARELLVAVRVCVAQPAVRRSGLRGPAADQAEASAWAAAWDALRRPSARTAENPMGMAWVAARRAVAAEASPDGMAHDHPFRTPLLLSVDDLIAGGWSPTAAPLWVEPVPLGPMTEAIASALVGAGWTSEGVEEALYLLAEGAQNRGAAVVVPWRGVADVLGIAHWRVRRLSTLLLGCAGGPGLVEIVAAHGAGVLSDPVLVDAVQSTTRRSRPGPEASLREWDELARASGPPLEQEDERCA